MNNGVGVIEQRLSIIEKMDSIFSIVNRIIDTHEKDTGFRG